MLRNFKCSNHDFSLECVHCLKTEIRSVVKQRDRALNERDGTMKFCDTLREKRNEQEQTIINLIIENDLLKQKAAKQCHGLGCDGCVDCKALDKNSTELDDLREKNRRLIEDSRQLHEVVTVASKVAADARTEAAGFKRDYIQVHAENEELRDQVDNLSEQNKRLIAQVSEFQAIGDFQKMKIAIECLKRAARAFWQIQLDESVYKTGQAERAFESVAMMARESEKKIDEALDEIGVKR